MMQVEDRSIRYIQRIRQISNILLIIRQPSNMRRLRRRNRYTMDHLMDMHGIDQRQVRIIITGEMRISHIVLNEMSEQRTFKEPLRIQLVVSSNRAEISHDLFVDRYGFLLSVHQSMQQIEINEQAFLVIHNLRLFGGHAYIVRIAVALIVDKERKLRRLSRFDYIFCQRIIGEDIPLHEIGQL